ncbi:hypothetical protein ES705_37255 [subsurface metagenome]
MSVLLTALVPPPSVLRIIRACPIAARLLIVKISSASLLSVEKLTCSLLFPTTATGPSVSSVTRAVLILSSMVNRETGISIFSSGPSTLGRLGRITKSELTGTDFSAWP